MLRRSSMWLRQVLCPQNPALLQPRKRPIRPALLKTPSHPPPPPPPSKERNSKANDDGNVAVASKKLRRQRKKRRAPTAEQQGQDLDEESQVQAKILKSVTEQGTRMTTNGDDHTIYGGHDHYDAEQCH